MALVLYLLCVALSVAVAAAKGRDPFGWFVCGALFHVFALVVLMVLPDLRER